MGKKLTEETLTALLEIGITEFAAHGPDRANINVVARKAGISVGVLYKYYESKAAFFHACLRHSLDVLVGALAQVTAQEGNLLAYAAAIIATIQAHARTHSDYMKLYLKLTAEGGENAARLAEEIEGVTAGLYPRFLAQARKGGNIRQDADPALFAFFFDNLLMMLQFSYCCDYYRARFRLFCGGDILERDEAVAAELLHFLESAFTTERTAIPHKAQGGKAP